MSSAKMTLIGLENYMQPDDSLFKDLVVPAGIDKDIMINNILMRANEFEVLYSDPDFLKAAITLWGRKWYHTFDKWITALNIQYDPLNNYDRHEEWTDDHTGDYSKKNTGSASGENTRTDDLTQTTDMTRENNLTETHDLATTNDVTTTNDVSAFNNASGYDPRDKQIVDGDGSDTGTITNTGTVDDDGTVTNTGTQKNEYSDESSGTESGDDKSKNIHKGHLYGNIGVTTSQQMLESELDIATWNIYEHIADIFLKEFCIMVY